MKYKFFKINANYCFCNTLLHFVTTAMPLHLVGKFNFQMKIKPLFVYAQPAKIGFSITQKYHFCHYGSLFFFRKFSIFPCYIVTNVTNSIFKKSKPLSVLHFIEFKGCNKPP